MCIWIIANERDKAGVLDVASLVHGQCGDEQISHQLGYIANRQGRLKHSIWSNITEYTLSTDRAG